MDRYDFQVERQVGHSSYRYPLDNNRWLERIVRVRERLRVLVPVNLVTFIVLFEVEFGMMKDDIWAHEVGSDISDQAGGELPEDWAAVIGALQSAHK